MSGESAAAGGAKGDHRTRREEFESIVTLQSEASASIPEITLKEGRDAQKRKARTIILLAFVGAVDFWNTRGVLRY